MSQHLDDLINELRQRYEYIFLDNVPVGMVADADIVKRVADTTVMVLRAGKTDKRLLFDVDKLSDEKADIKLWNGQWWRRGIRLNALKFCF